jgi:hypothetical protein
MEIKQQTLGSSEPEICSKIMAVIPSSKLMFDLTESKLKLQRKYHPLLFVYKCQAYNNLSLLPPQTLECVQS